MEWQQPPRTYAELMLWKVYSRSQDFSVWGIIHKWIKTYGNPYECTDNYPDYDLEDARQLFKLALDYVVTHK